MTSGTPPTNVGFTGPSGDRRRYHVTDLMDRQRGGVGTIFRAVLTESVDGLATGTPIGLKLLHGVTQDRFDKLQERLGSLPPDPHLAVAVECFTGPPLAAGSDDEDDYVWYSAHVWVQGRSLDTLIADASSDEVLRWAQGLASALDALHSAPFGGLAHRDLHPRNVVITPESQAVLIDFDALLVKDHRDTTLTINHFSQDAFEPGLKGSQTNDRARLASLILHGLAREPDFDRPIEIVRAAAMHHLRNAPHPRRTVDELISWTRQPPPRAGELVDQLNALVTPGPRRSSSRRGARIAGMAAVLAIGSLAAISIIGRAATPNSVALLAPSTSLPAYTPGTTTGPQRAGPTGPHRGHPSRRPSSAPPHSVAPTSTLPGPSPSPPSASSASVTSPSAFPTTDPSTAAPTSLPVTPHPTEQPPTVASTSSEPTVTPSTSPPISGDYAETPGTVVNTWSDYRTASGDSGPQIGSRATVEVICRVRGFKVADGDTWWYRIASAPWSGDYYGSADAFYNNRSTSGSLTGTPLVDPAVKLCPVSDLSPETPGTAVNTWTNYTTADGSAGPRVPASQTVEVVCRVQGFQVADGDTWWYRIASAPWNGDYYGSADAFYNNGSTSGSLHGTPFFDPAVPTCS